MINYFDSFGMPPFEEIVNHANKKNLILLHQNNQIKNLSTTTFVYFLSYFLNEKYKGGAVDIHKMIGVISKPHERLGITWK